MSKSNKLNEMRLLNLPATMGKAELKIANAIYSKVAPEDEDFKEYTLTISELAKLAGLEKDRLHKNIKRITANLLGTVITIEKPDSRSYLQASVFCTAEYEAKDGYVYFQIAPKLAPYLLRLKDAGCGFTQYYLEQTTRLQSKHSLRLYELLRQFLPLKKVREEGQTSGFRKVLVSDLREYLGVQNKYPRFGDFREKVLEPAQKELAEKTDIAFTFTPERTRRTITSLNFLIKANQKERFQLETYQGIALQPGDTIENGIRVDANGIPYFDEFAKDHDLKQQCRDREMLDKLQAAVPSLPLEQAIFLVNNYSREMLTESLLGLLTALSTGQVQTTPAKYLLGILKNKNREETEQPTRTNKTPEEKLTDRSWMEGLDLKSMDDWD